MTVACDVLVLGAGPAGSSLALRLARDGFAVALADRKAFPRPKPCGEFLSPACLPFLRECGVADALFADGMATTGAMRLHGFGRVAEGAFRPLLRPGAGRHGFGVRREVLDHRLLEAAVQAGVRFLPRHEFRALQRDAGGRVHGAVLRDPDGASLLAEARLTIGADGVRSPVARALGVQRRLGWLDRFALTTHFEGVPQAPHAEVHFFDGGYFAATTVDRGLFGVNLLIDRNALRDHTPGDWDAFVDERLQRAPEFAERLAGTRRTGAWRGTGPLAFATSRQHAPGVALVGDACGYVDPMTGEGIYFALWGAARLAAAATDALREPADEGRALAAYARDRRREVGPRLWLSKLLQRGRPHAFVVRSLLGVMQRHPAVADLLITMTGDGAHPRDLLRPSFWRDFRRAEPA